MKKNVISILGIIAIATVICFSMAACDNSTPTPPPVKTVSVGAQSGILTEGVAGTATFLLTTENISNGSYTVTVSDLPDGMEVSGEVTITNNSGVLQLEGDESIRQGTSSLTLTIDGTTSEAFTLLIRPPNVKVVQVGVQNEKVIAGNAGTVTFPVNTAYIANGSYYVDVANLPSGVLVADQVTISGGSGTLTLSTSTATASGIANLTLTIDGATSDAFTLTIEPKTVLVGAQRGILVEETAGTVTFLVATENIANGSHNVTVGNLPAGVSGPGSVTIANNSGTLTLTASGSITPGTRSLTLTIDGVTSEAFTLTIGSFEIEEVRIEGTSSFTVNGKTVRISPFLMGKYEVTQYQWLKVMHGNELGISEKPSFYQDNPAAGEEQGKRPVESVSWYEMIVFCNLLSMEEGLTPAYRVTVTTPGSYSYGGTDPADWVAVPTGSNNVTWNVSFATESSVGYHLPTEVQWEYAARAGTSSVYSFGSTWNNDYGWVSENSDNMPHEVGKKLPNAWGLYDMHGNVWEWCWDWYKLDNYPQDPGWNVQPVFTDPRGPDSGTTRTARGGSWYNEAGIATSAYRDGHFETGGHSSYIGFRVVRPVQ